MNRRALLAFAGLTALSVGLKIATAAPALPYDAKAVAAAQAAGDTVLLHITAPWCPTCQAQKPVIDALLAKPAYAKVKLYLIDFDSQKDLLKSLNVRSQSTLIVYKGTTEIGRSAGQVAEAAIEGLIKPAL